MVAMLALGTVQLGVPYGAANHTGMPSEAEAIALVHQAAEAGITLIDTAQGYGLSEARIGKARLPKHITISTKISPTIDSAKDIPDALNASCTALKRDRLDVVMLHRWAQYAPLWPALVAQKQQGKIGQLGASISTPEEAISALAVPEVTFIQLPCNILDWRWHTPEITAAFMRRHDVHIQVRSALLQGLLAGGDAAQWPLWCTAKNAILTHLDALVAQLNRPSRLALCYAYLRALPWIHSIVVGMETPAQLQENHQLFTLPALDNTGIEAAKTCFTPSTVPVQLLNPAEW